MNFPGAGSSDFSRSAPDGAARRSTADRRKASTLIADILAVADRICARPFSDAVMAEQVAELEAELEQHRAAMVEGKPFVGDAEEMLLMALGQVAGGDHPSDLRKRWARVAGVIVELVQPNLLNALAREALPASTSESVEAEGHQGRAR